MFAARQQFRLHSTTSVVDYKVNRIDKNLHNSVRSANRHTRAALYSRVDLIGQSRLRREFYKAADSIK